MIIKEKYVIKGPLTRVPICFFFLIRILLKVKRGAVIQRQQE